MTTKIKELSRVEYDQRVDSLLGQVERLTAEIDSVQAASLTMIDRLTAERDALAEDLDRQAGLARTRLSAGMACEKACASLRTRAETAEAGRDELSDELVAAWLERDDRTRERDEARREAVGIAAIARDGDDEDANLRRVADDYGWGYLFEPGAALTVAGDECECEYEGEGFLGEGSRFKPKRIPNHDCPIHADPCETCDGSGEPKDPSS